MSGALQVISRPVLLQAGGLSGVVDLRSHRLLAIQMPAAWSTAAIGFFSQPFASREETHGSNDAYQFATALDVADGEYVLLTSSERAMCDGLALVKLLSVDPASLPDEVVQAANREIVLIGSPRS